MNRNRALIVGVGIAALLAGAVVAQERIQLGTPETAPNNVHYELNRLIIIADDPATAAADEGVLTIQFRGVERPSQEASCVYSASTNPTGTFLITALNKANLSTAYAANATTGSLRQRIHHRLVVMNEAPAVCGRSLAGSLAGSPQ